MADAPDFPLDDACPDADWRRIAVHVREEIARRRMSRQKLADIAQISLSTLEKALAGKRSFTLATLVRLEQALGVPLRDVVPAAAPFSPATTAPESLGGYSRQSVSWLEGRYLTLRPGFNRPEAVYAYLTTIWWDEVQASLVFAESGRQDAKYAQTGVVAAPYLSSHIYLITNDRGQFRTLTLGRPTLDRAMHGILSTLFAGDGTHLTPISCPVVLQWLDESDTPELGETLPAHAPYADRRQAIDTTLRQGFAAFRS